MNSRLQQLYEAMILEHNKNPRNFKMIENCSHTSHGKNPLCGDDYYVFFKVDDQNVIQDIGFLGQGCAISKSSGSLMTEMVKGKSVSDVLLLKDAFLHMVTEGIMDSEKELLGKLTVFEGVRQYPVRVKCAALVWRALEDALSQSTGTVSTE